MTVERKDLDPWLDAARADLASLMPPRWLAPQLEARVDERRALQAVRRSSATRSSVPQRAGMRWQMSWIGAAAALAATVLISTLLPVALSPGAPTVAASSGPQFMALVPLEDLAAERGTLLVPGQIPRPRLAEYGLPVDPARADQPARAEFLLSARGVVLAVRFVE
jgi:hypothetical protein